MDIFVVTLLNIVMCGEGQSEAAGTCKIQTELYEAHSMQEAEDDWQGCNEDLKKIQELHPKSYCYQFDPNQPTASYKQAMKKWVL